MRSTAELLVVDDSPADAELTGEILSQTRYPHHVSFVSNGMEALSLLRREGKYVLAPTPDLVILDLNLPRVDGRSVLAQVKSDPALRTIPVIVFSTSQARLDILRSYELGANGYVSKPGNLGDFTAAVQSIGEFWLGFAHLPPEAQL
jgi:chemotaxis family two-component system response regulator Rcp1